MQHRPTVKSFERWVRSTRLCGYVCSPFGGRRVATAAAAEESPPPPLALWTTRQHGFLPFPSTTLYRRTTSGAAAQYPPDP